ncbi:MAG: hypothetical protein GX295_05560 [Syntrophomonadaceae bacterium]|nr:hypothetical protein [Syntrophomonadaceae bacterium]
MSFKELHWTSIILGMLITFGILVGGNGLYQHYLIKNPLGEALQQRPEIISWDLEKETAKKTLTIRLGPVSNLKESCNYIQNTSSRYLGTEGVEIHLIDQRSEELKQTMYDLQFPIHEALAQGSYTQLAEAISKGTQDSELTDYQIYVDENYLYVQLMKNNAYLYEILPRTNEIQTLIVVPEDEWPEKSIAWNGSLFHSLINFIN